MIIMMIVRYAYSKKDDKDDNSITTNDNSNKYLISLKTNLIKGFAVS